MTVGPSLWGHDRTWLPDEQRAQARDMRLKAARDGMREPVNVIEGNFHRMQGVCPWWDKMVEASAQGTRCKAEACELSWPAPWCPVAAMMMRGVLFAAHPLDPPPLIA